MRENATIEVNYLWGSCQGTTNAEPVELFLHKKERSTQLSTSQPQDMKFCTFYSDQKKKRKLGKREFSCFIEYLIATNTQANGGENLTPSFASKCDSAECSVSKLFKEARDPQCTGLHSEGSPVILLLQLSFREMEVLVRLAGFDSIKVIAKKMKISNLTADGYVKRIYSKLHVNTRTECTLFLSRNMPIFQKQIADWRPDLYI